MSQSQTDLFVNALSDESISSPAKVEKQKSGFEGLKK